MMIAVRRRKGDYDQTTPLNVGRRVSETSIFLPETRKVLGMKRVRGSAFAIGGPLTNFISDMDVKSACCARIWHAEDETPKNFLVDAAFNDVLASRVRHLPPSRPFQERTLDDGFSVLAFFVGSDFLCLGFFSKAF